MVYLIRAHLLLLAPVAMPRQEHVRLESRRAIAMAACSWTRLTAISLTRRAALHVANQVEFVVLRTQLQNAQALVEFPLKAALAPVRNALPLVSVPIIAVLANRLSVPVSLAAMTLLFAVPFVLLIIPAVRQDRPGMRLV